MGWCVVLMNGGILLFMLGDFVMYDIIALAEANPTASKY